MRGIIVLIGIIVLLFLMFLLSNKKKEINYKIIGKALLVQFIIAFLLVKFEPGRHAIEAFSNKVTTVLNYGFEGLKFVFGSLANPAAPSGWIFIIMALGNIIFLSALVAALFYLGILGFIVKVIGKIVGMILGTTQAESFVAVANMFLGQTESPILVSKYLGKMTDSEIMVVLISGMGSMSATILGGYSSLGIPMKYLLIASALVPFGSIAISKILLPETEHSKVQGDVSIDRKGNHENIVSAITEGAVNGMYAVIAIAATLIAFISLVALLNGLLSPFNITLQKIFAFVFSPFGYSMGLSGNEAKYAGELLGTKLILNEFVAFESLGKVISSFSDRTQIILTIAMAGFANVASMGVCISGISVLCPEQRPVLARLAFKAMLGGFAVSLLSAMVVGFITLF